MAGEHTPGPWEVTDGGDEYENYIRVWACEAKVDGASEPLIAEISHLEGAAHECTVAEARANARLIAAAPDGLALAKALDAHWTEAVPHGPGEPGDKRLLDESTLVIWRQCRAFIARATPAEGE